MHLKNLFNYSFPIINCGDIVLRELQGEDASNYLTYMNNATMRNFVTQENIPNNLDSALNELRYWRNLFLNQRSVYWGVTLSANDQLIGTAGFNSISFANARADISYDLDPNFWGKGYMLKAIKNILAFADNALGLVRIQATVIIHNQRSIKLLERCGFQREGLLHKYEIVDSQYEDYYMYARLTI